MPRIRVQERGEIDLTNEQWLSLSSSDDFWEARDRGIIKVNQMSSKLHRLQASCYVGKIYCNNVILELTEKIPGALQGLLKFASWDAFRIEPVSGVSSDIGELIALLIDQFLHLLKRYASRGREFQYEQRRYQGSLVGGRVDVTRSIQLRARGLRHQIAFDKNVLTFNTEANQVVILALREVNRVARAVSLPDHVIQRARGFAMIFEDCISPKLLALRREEAIRIAERNLSSTSNTLLRDVLGLARVILAHESFEQKSVMDSQLPRAWFINLESLFERAVRRVLEVVSGGSCEVTKSGTFSPRVFASSGDEYRACPDIVMRKNESVAVGDVKYKMWSGSAEHSDVYQLLVHASSYASKVCFLVFPGTSFNARCLGRSTTGQETWFFEVDVTNLHTCLKQVLEIVFPATQHA
jgi:5-methylcytosine-specific restriction endonuclease McrBC regulatory subunit McrC